MSQARTRDVLSEVFQTIEDVEPQDDFLSKVFAAPPKQDDLDRPEVKIADRYRLGPEEGHFRATLDAPAVIPGLERRGVGLSETSRTDLYDYEAAATAGLQRDETGHLPSRVPHGVNEGLLLKLPGHPTWRQTLDAEEAEGFQIVESGGRMYSFPKGDDRLTGEGFEPPEVDPHEGFVQELREGLAFGLASSTGGALAGLGENPEADYLRDLHGRGIFEKGADWVIDVVNAQPPRGVPEGQGVGGFIGRTAGDIVGSFATAPLLALSVMRTGMAEAQRTLDQTDGNYIAAMVNGTLGGAKTITFFRLAGMGGKTAGLRTGTLGTPYKLMWDTAAKKHVFVLEKAIIGGNRETITQTLKKIGADVSVGIGGAAALEPVTFALEEFSSAMFSENVTFSQALDSIAEETPRLTLEGIFGALFIGAFSATPAALQMQLKLRMEMRRAEAAGDSARVRQALKDAISFAERHDASRSFVDNIPVERLETSRIDAERKNTQRPNNPGLIAHLDLIDQRIAAIAHGRMGPVTAVEAQAIARLERRGIELEAARIEAEAEKVADAKPKRTTDEGRLLTGRVDEGPFDPLAVTPVEARAAEAARTTARDRPQAATAEGFERGPVPEGVTELEHGMTVRAPAGVSLKSLDVKGIQAKYPDPIGQVNAAMEAHAIATEAAEQAGERTGTIITELDTFALHPDQISALTPIRQAQLTKQFGVHQEAQSIRDIPGVGPELYDRAVSHALATKPEREASHTDLLLTTPELVEPQDWLNLFMSQARQEFSAETEAGTTRKALREHRFNWLDPATLEEGMQFTIFGRDVEVVADERFPGTLSLEVVNRGVMPVDALTEVPVDRGSLKEAPVPVEIPEEAAPAGEPTGPTRTELFNQALSQTRDSRDRGILNRLLLHGPSSLAEVTEAAGFKFGQSGALRQVNESANRLIAAGLITRQFDEFSLTEKAGGGPQAARELPTADDHFAQAQARIDARAAFVTENEGRTFEAPRPGIEGGRVIVSPDVSFPGQWRMTYFDAKGPVGHVGPVTYKSAVQEADHFGAELDKAIFATEAAVEAAPGAEMTLEEAQARLESAEANRGIVSAQGDMARAATFDAEIAELRARVRELTPEPVDYTGLKVGDTIPHPDPANHVLLEMTGPGSEAQREDPVFITHGEHAGKTAIVLDKMDDKVFVTFGFGTPRTPIRNEHALKFNSQFQPRPGEEPPPAEGGPPVPATPTPPEGAPPEGVTPPAEGAIVEREAPEARRIEGTGPEAPPNPVADAIESMIQRAVVNDEVDARALDIEERNTNPQVILDFFFNEVYPNLSPRRQTWVHRNVIRRIFDVEPGYEIEVDREGNVVRTLDTWEEIAREVYRGMTESERLDQFELQGLAVFEWLSEGARTVKDTDVQQAKETAQLETHADRTVAEGMGPSIPGEFEGTAVADADGNPITVYHGSAQLKPGELPTRRDVGPAGQERGLVGIDAIGFWFSAAYTEAEAFGTIWGSALEPDAGKIISRKIGTNVVSAELNMQSPLVFDTPEAFWEWANTYAVHHGLTPERAQELIEEGRMPRGSIDAEAVRERLRLGNKDGIIIRRGGASDSFKTEADWFLVLEPTQIRRPNQKEPAAEPPPEPADAPKVKTEEFLGRTITTDNPPLMRNVAQEGTPFGGAASVAGADAIKVIHVTDHPRELEEYLDSGASLVEGRAEGLYGELGRGLYGSAVPQLWTGRSPAKYSFLDRLTDEQMTGLLDYLTQQVLAQRDSKYITEPEESYALRLIEQVRDGSFDNASPLVQLSGQPYNTAFWLPENLEPLGIEPGQQPQEVELTLQGKFAELKRQITEDEAQALRDQGYDGAYTRASMGTNPELVIWERRAVVESRGPGEPDPHASFKRLPFNTRDGHTWLMGDTAPFQFEDGKLLLYHGTSEAAAEKIIEDGMVVRDESGSVGFSTTALGARRMAIEESGQEGVVVSFQLDPLTLPNDAVERSLSGHTNLFNAVPEVGEAGLVAGFAEVVFRQGRPPTVIETAAAAETVHLRDMTVAELFDLKSRDVESQPLWPPPAKTVSAATPAGKVFRTSEQGAAQLEAWKQEARRIRDEEDHSNDVVLSLFDITGTWSKPYEEAGYDVRRFDIKSGEDLVAFFPVDVIAEIHRAGKRVVAVLGAPPCTSFACSGARWWKTQHDVVSEEHVGNKYGLWATGYFDRPIDYAKTLIQITEEIVAISNPQFYVLENPIGRIQKEANLPKPAMRFHPHHYGDPYTKQTQLWGEFNTDLPTNNVEPTEGSLMHKLRGDVKADKARRSQTPEGFAYAFFMANQASDPPGGEMSARKPSPLRKLPQDKASVFFSGTHTDQAAARSQARGDMGLMLNPNTGMEKHVDKYKWVAVDNGAFGKGGFKPEKFLKLLDSLKGKEDKVAFVVAPDVVGNAEETLKLWPEWRDKIRARGFPVAFVLQNGAENMMNKLPYEDADVLFVGGSTDWKLGEFGKDWEAHRNWIDMFRFADQNNIPVHVGRVNSWKRFEIAMYGLGARSSDGNILKFGPDVNIERVEDWLNKWNKEGWEQVNLERAQLERKLSVVQPEALARNLAGARDQGGEIHPIPEELQTGDGATEFINAGPGELEQDRIRELSAMANEPNGVRKMTAAERNELKVAVEAGKIPAETTARTRREEEEGLARRRAEKFPESEEVPPLVEEEAPPLVEQQGQPGLLGPEHAGPVTGAQGDLPLPKPSTVEQQLETEQEAKRAKLDKDESEQFPFMPPKTPPGMRRGMVDPGFLMAPVRPIARKARGATAVWLGVKDWLFEDITRDVGQQGGLAGRQVERMMMRATNLAKQTIGELMPFRDLIANNLRMSPGVSWDLQEILWQTGTVVPLGEAQAGYSKVVAAVEGRMDLNDLTPKARAFVLDWRLMMEHTGQILEDMGWLMRQPGTGALQPFVRTPGGTVWPRVPTEYLVDLYANPSGPFWEAYVQMIARENNWPVSQARRRLEPLKQHSFHRIGPEVARLIPKHPTHMRWRNPNPRDPRGDRVYPLLMSHPTGATAGFIRMFSLRVGVVSQFGQGYRGPNGEMSKLEKIRDRYIQSGGDAEAFDRGIRALSGIQTAPPMRGLGPGSPQYEVVNDLKMVVNLARSSALTRAAVPNIPEFLGNIRAYGGTRRTFQAMKDMVSLSDSYANRLIQSGLLPPGVTVRAGTAELIRLTERLGIVAQDVLDITVDRDRYIRGMTAKFGEGLTRVFQTNRAWVWQERHASATGLRAALEMMEGLGTVNDYMTALALKFDKATATKLSEGNATPEQYLDYARRFAAFTNSTRMTLPAEESRAVNSRWWTAWISFSRYPFMRARMFGRDVGNWYEAGRAYQKNPSAENWKRFRASHWRIVNLMAGTTASGVLYDLILSAIFGGEEGIIQVLGDFKEDPAQTMAEWWWMGMQGPIINSLSRMVKERKFEELLGISFSAGLIGDLVEYSWAIGTGTGIGSYQDLGRIEATYKLMNRYSPGGRSILQMAGLFGITDRDTELEFAIRTFYEWKRDQDDIPSVRVERVRDEEVQKEFRVNMRRAADLLKGRDRRDPEVVKEVEQLIYNALQIKREQLGSMRQARNVVAQSLRSRQLMDDIDREKKLRFLERHGEKVFNTIAAYDGVLRMWADTYANKPVVGRRKE